MGKAQRRNMDHVIEFLKEIGRVALFSVISYLLTAGVVQAIVTSISGTRLDPGTQLLITGGILAVLRALDKTLHDSGIAPKGLAQF